MGHNDRYDSEDRDYKEYLATLLDKLNGPAKGITKLIIDKGFDALSDKQKYVFEKEVAGHYIIEECKLCNDSIPWCEMEAAIDNGGYCSHCEHILSKDDD